MKKHVKINQKSFGNDDDVVDDDDDDDDVDGEDDDDDDNVVDDLPEEQGRAEEQFLGLVESAQDSGFSAPKRKHCCSLDVGVSNAQHI